MYNLSVDEISMVDGGGDGSYNNSPSTGTSYGGQGGGFVGTSAENSLGSACGLAIAGAGLSVAGAIASGGSLTGVAMASVGAVLGAGSACRS